MDYDFAMKWADALESGKYKQTKGVLYDGDGYCCLGVAAVLAGEKFVPRKTFWQRLKRFASKKDVGFKIQSSTDTSVLSPEVRGKFGMKHSDGSYFAKNKFNIIETLTSLNDGGKTFPEIAKVIRKNYQSL